MARGIAAAQAASLAVSESARDIVAPSGPGALLDALIAAAAAFDATRFDALLDAAFGQGTVAGIRDVVLPVLAEIGERWQSNEIGVGHEHFASHLIERRLLSLATGWEAGHGPLALLACPSGERHTLGLGRRHHTILAGSGVTAALAQRLGVHHAEGDPVITAQALAERPAAKRSSAPAP